MPDHNRDGRRRVSDIITMQLRGFDQRLADFRVYYDSCDAEDRTRFRAWLERAAALNEEGSELGALIQIRTELDLCDSDGNRTSWVDAEFSPSTMMSAIRAWEKGEEFTPSSIQP